MRAATYTQSQGIGEGFSVEEIPDPEIGEGELLIKVSASSICGTDVKIVRKGHRKLADGQRIVLGHELCGEVVESKAINPAPAVGQRIGIAPNTGCGRCRPCQRGQSNYCQNYEAFGITRDGSHATFLRVPMMYLEQGNVVPLPDGFPDEEATLLEPLSCVVGGAQAVNIGPGDRVVIYGPGTMGQLFVQVARLSEASQILVVGRNPDRLAAAKNAGADVVIDNSNETSAVDAILEGTGGEGADVVITACASEAPLLEATEVLAPFGRLCLFGSLPKGADLPRFDTNTVHYKKLVVTGTTGGSVADYQSAMQLASSRRIDLRSIIGARFSLADLDAAYRAALDGSVAGKIVLLADDSLL